MIESIQQLWPIMMGENGFPAAVVAWRGAIGLTVPVVNTWIQSKFTEILVNSPSIANEIVHSKRWKIANLTLRLLFGLKLPDENSLIVHEVKEQKKLETSMLNKP